MEKQKNILSECKKRAERLSYKWEELSEDDKKEFIELEIDCEKFADDMHDKFFNPDNPELNENE